MVGKIAQPLSERAGPLIDQMQLAAFRQSLPQSQRCEGHRFFVVRWDSVKARFLTQQPDRRLDSLLRLNA
jgi:hypothetical protein